MGLFPAMAFDSGYKLKVVVEQVLGNTAKLFKLIFEKFHIIGQLTDFPDFHIENTFEAFNGAFVFFGLVGVVVNGR